MLLQIEHFISAFLLLTSFMIIFFKKKYQYFEKRGIPFLQPQIPFGNIVTAILGRESMEENIRILYRRIKENSWKYGGIFLFTNPIILLTDMNIIKNIMSTDFDYFIDRPAYLNERDDPLNVNVSQMLGTRWKNTRSKVGPVFSSAKMKMIFHSMADSQQTLYNQINKLKKEPLKIQQIISHYINEAIASSAFGLDLRKLEHDKFNEYKFYAAKTSIINSIKFLFCFNFPEIAKLCRLRFFQRDVTNYFLKILKDSVDHRKMNNLRRNDILQKLIDLKNDSENEPITWNEMASHAFIVLVAAYGPSSVIISLTLYELARNQKLQDKLRAEVKKIFKNDGKITYDGLQDMEFLTQIIKETLRLYSPIGFTIRICDKDYKVPNEDLVIKQGEWILIPMWSIHTDEEHYPDPEIYNPDRFTNENKALRHKFAYMPFGHGPRYCIGQRFSMLQIQVALAAIINKYKITVNEKTIQPLQFEKRSLVMTLAEDIWLNVTDL